MNESLLNKGNWLFREIDRIKDFLKSFRAEVDENGHYWSFSKGFLKIETVRKYSVFGIRVHDNDKTKIIKLPSSAIFFIENEVKKTVEKLEDEFKNLK